MNLNPQDNVTFIGDALTKLTTEEVYHIAVDTKDSIFREAFKGHMNDAVITLKRYLDEMDEHKDGYFVRHYVRNSKMRKILDQTFKLSTSRYAEYANLINDKNVLLLDDTISRGQSIQEACKIIESSYNPKSVSVLTLMSKLK